MPTKDKIPDHLIQLVIVATIRAHLLTDKSTAECRIAIEDYVAGNYNLFQLMAMNDANFTATFKEFWSIPNVRKRKAQRLRDSQGRDSASCQQPGT